MRHVNQAFKKINSFKANCPQAASLLLLALLSPFSINAQLYSGDTQTIGLSLSNPISSRSIGVTTKAASTSSCSNYTTAPRNAQSLSNGTYTYVVTGSSSGTIWGTGTYTDDSPIATAAVHNGHVTVGAKAVIRLTKSAGLSSYSGSTKNGVTSSNYGSWSGSYSMTFVSTCTTSSNPPPTSTASCTTYTTAPADARSLSNGTYTYVVTGSSSGTIWGTGTYTDDSPIAKAAVHDGHVAVGAKAAIRLTKSGGLPSYAGSTQNGITSSSYGSWSGSYSMTFVRSCSKSTTPTTPTTPATQETDTDGDGIADSVDTDDDNDGMSDSWELEHQLNPLNASDAALDADNDTHTNLAEYNAGSDPNWNLSKPGSIPVMAAGFDNRYTVQRGFINSDMLQDLLIQDPTAGILPAVKRFVLIQQEAGGFTLESTDNYTIPSASKLTTINSVIRLHDLNADGVTDMLLHGLNGYIDNAGDQIIYTNTDEKYVIPSAHVGLATEVKQFFSDVADWISDEKHFRNKARLTSTIPITTSVTDLPTRPGVATYGQINLNQALLVSNLGKCIGLSPTLCYLITYDGLINSFDRSLFDDLVLIASRYRVAVYVEPDLRIRPRTVNVYDFFGADRTAILLVASYFAPIRNSGTMDRGSVAAIAISETLGAMLNSSVFDGGLESVSDGVFPAVGDYSSYEEIVRDILIVFEYILGRITPPCDNDETCTRRFAPFVYPPLVCTPDFKLEENYKISTTPSMPSINLSVSNSSSLPPGATINWRAQVKYAPQGTGCSGGPNFDSQVITGQGSSFSPSFNGFFGGELTVTASCSARNFLTGSRQKTSSITGMVPSDAVMAAAIPSLPTPFQSADLRRIACHESRFTHFLSNGLPYIGTGGMGGDAGLMQICYKRKTEDFWNFRSNISSGLQILTGDTESLGSARRWLAKVVKEAEDDGHELVLTDDHYRKEAIHRYNAGTGEAKNAYWEWNSEEEVLKMVARGGVSSGYVDAVLSRLANCTN